VDYAAIEAAPSLSSGHLLGTDELGRDILLQLLQCGAGSIRLALLTAGLAGAILAVWRLADRGGGPRLRRWGELLQGLFDALPFLLLAVVLHGWYPAEVASETVGVIGLVWLSLWLALRCGWPVARAICSAVAASLVGEAYLAGFGVTDFEPPTTLGSLLAAGLGGIDTAPWSVLAAMAGLILLAGSAALVAGRMQESSARG
jgi:ABC-type dipeptide/oligopeptide/nickel transport system permease subunit